MSQINHRAREAYDGRKRALADLSKYTYEILILLQYVEHLEISDEDMYLELSIIVNVHFAQKIL